MCVEVKETSFGIESALLGKYHNLLNLKTLGVALS